MSGALLIRVDADPVTGTGHVMRTLALAQAWQREGGRVAMAMRSGSASLEAQLQSLGYRVHPIQAEPATSDDAAQVARLAREEGAAWAVVDGYGFAATYQQAIRDAGLRLLAIDDFGRIRSHCAELILDQNLGTGERFYADRAGHSRLLLGPRYVMLRREFWPFCGWRRQVADRAQRVLVTLGGADPDNVTLKVIEAIDRLAEHRLQCRVVVGSVNPHREQLEKAVRKSRARIELASHVTDMTEPMRWADVAISAGGTTCWELAFLGLPNAIVVLAENQAGVAEALAREGVSINLGVHSAVGSERIAEALGVLVRDDAARRRMSERGQRLIDGQGVGRVVTRLRAAQLRLRAAQPGDCRQLWEWANDPTVRAWAFSQAPIPWEEHVRWFQQKLRSPNCALFIAADEAGDALGQVRLEWDSRGEAEVHISVAKERRGAGIGSALIRRVVDQAWDEPSARAIHAHVKPENEASLRAFERAGFRRVGPVTVRDHDAVRLTVSKQDDP